MEFNDNEKFWMRMWGWFGITSDQTKIKGQAPSKNDENDFEMYGQYYGVAELRSMAEAANSIADKLNKH